MTQAFSPVVMSLLNAAPGAYSALVAPGTTPPATRSLMEGVFADQLPSSLDASPAYAAAMLAGLWLWHDGLAECHEIAQKSPEYFDEAAEDRRRAQSGGSAPRADGGGNAASSGDPNSGADSSAKPPVKMTMKISLSAAAPAREIDPAARRAYLRDAAATLNFWHAIMHRREGDFSNSKYWYARCADHPCLATLTAQAPQIINHAPANKRLLKISLNGWDPDVWVDFVESVHQRPDDPHFETAVQLQRMEWRVLFEHCARA